MDRTIAATVKVSRRKIAWVIATFAVLTALVQLVWIKRVDAEVQLLNPPAKDDTRPEEKYQESRFGVTPVGASVSRTNDEIETDNRERGARKPASLSLDGKVVADPLPGSVVSRKGVQEVAVIAGDQGFFPKTVFVTRDIPVRLFVTGASKHTLCIMMDSFSVRKQVRTNRIEEITFTPGLAGKFRFHCPVNGMEGTMIVKELASREE